MSATIQINFRLPSELKNKASHKAWLIWTNLNNLIKIFLQKFVTENDIIEMKQDVNFEKIFDKWTIEYFESQKWINRTKNINLMLQNAIKNNEKNYLV